MFNFLTRWSNRKSAGTYRYDVGVVSTHIPPALGYGGVPVTAGVLTKAWARLGKRIALVASDESTAGRLKPADVRLGETVAVDLYHCYGFRRWGFGLEAIPKLWRLCRAVPLVYIHGIATWPTTIAGLICVLTGKPFMVAVHGGMMPEHVALIRRRKPHKWLYYKLLTFPTLRRAMAVHCTSDTEVQGVRDCLGPSARILLVPNGVEQVDQPIVGGPEGAGRQICFLGHIQQEKGINAFIRAWLEVRGPDDRLVIAGRSLDAAYFAEFEALIARAPEAIRYRGYLPKDEVQQLLAASHYLVLASGLEESGGMRENFGNVVAEAMAAGRPVLVAKGLAWDHVETLGAGFVFERSAASVREVLGRALALSRSDWLRMSDKARRFVELHLDPVRLARKIWQELAGASPEPVKENLSYE